MSQQPLVSVVMPVYNAERFVAQAAESILVQTYPNFEFLIVDDGSTDRSLLILERYAAQDTRIRLRSGPNAGYVHRLNEMLDEARGDFVARMDADDIALPERLERQVAFLLANPDHAAVGSQILVIDSDGDPLCVWCKQQTHEEIDALLLSGPNVTAIGHPAVMYHREVVLAAGKYRVDCRPAEDVDLFLRLAEDGGRLANLPLVLLNYRMHLGSVCHLELTNQWEEVQDIIREARRRRGLPDVPIVKSNGSEKPDRPVDYRMRWGWWALISGYVSTARKHARYCLIHAPFSKETWRLLYCSIRGH